MTTTATERIERPDHPRWIKVTLSEEALQVRARHSTPWGNGFFSVICLGVFLSTLLGVLLLIAQRSLPFGLSPLAGLLSAIVLCCLFLAVIGDEVKAWLGKTASVEFTRDGRIRVYRQHGGQRFYDYRPADTYQVAFGVVDPDEQKRYQISRNEGLFNDWLRKLWANAGRVEFRFGAEQISLGIFSKRRQAEEFVAVCNWAKREVEGANVAAEDVAQTVG